MNTSLRSLREELELHFKRGQWSMLVGALDALSQLGQTEGRLELSLRAQGLREMIGERNAGLVTAPPRAQALFEDLMIQVEHIQWDLETSL